MFHKVLGALLAGLMLAGCAAPTAAVTPAPTAGPATAAATSAATPIVAPSATAAEPATATSPAAEPTGTEVRPSATPPVDGGTESPAATPGDSACSLAYTDGNTLSCNREDGTPVQIAAADGHINPPQISSDGAYVAYTVTREDGSTPLYVAAIGREPRLMADREQLPSQDPNRFNTPLVFQWRPGTHTLYFNTRFVIVSGTQGPGDRLNADLWSVDADSGAVQAVLPAQTAGRFWVSPDGTHVALSAASKIQLLDLASGNRQDVLQFPFVKTFGSFSYFPPAVWSRDSSFFTVVIPSENLKAPDASTTVYRAGLDGQAQKVGTLAGALLGADPSPDGRYLAYVSNDANNPDAGTALHLARTDGGGDQVVDRQPGLFALTWSPDSRYFAYSAGSIGGFAAGVDGSKQPYGTGARIVQAEWAASDELYYYGQVSGEWRIDSQRLDEKDTQTWATGLTEGNAFDVLRVER